MPDSSQSPSPLVAVLLEKLDQAQAAGLLQGSTHEHVTLWLTNAAYEEFVPAISEAIQAERWVELNDAFWTIIPFGTGGRRGKMHAFGTNTINSRTIGESAQALANYVRAYYRKEGLDESQMSCAVAYDTRHRSREFAELCSEVMVAAGFNVFFLDGYRSTPELSVAVRHQQCSCGIMVTASHNPPSDNAVKVYWASGAQVLPPHDKAIVAESKRIDQIDRTPFAEALQDGRIVYCEQEVDAYYLKCMLEQSTPGPRDLRILYSPLHGVGASAIVPALTQAGFEDVEVFPPHQEPNGDFPNVPGHVSNPENPRVFDSMIEHAQTSGAQLILCTDPDADRLGVAAPLVSGGAWKTFTGNQIAALLVDYVLSIKAQANELSSSHYVVKTLVTTDLVESIARSYGVKTYGNLHVGFKWIAKTMDDVGPGGFLFGCEESHGYQAGTYTRDKDAGVAALLMSELAARCQAEGITLHQQLDQLFLKHGCFAERTESTMLPGAEGMLRMQRVMEQIRFEPPQQLAGLPVVEVQDYLNLLIVSPGNHQEMPLEGTKGDMLLLVLAAPSTYIAVRPSGTEPKIKLYMFSKHAASSLEELPAVKQELESQFDRIYGDLEKLVASIE